MLQDIAVIVPEDVPAARLAEVVRAGAGELLGSLRVFDLYHGEQVGEGNKSLALRLEFRAPDRTLTDEEVAERRAAIEKRAGVDRRAPACLTEVAVIGAAGYGGGCAAAILRRHPSLELTAVTPRRRMPGARPRRAVSALSRAARARGVRRRPDRRAAPSRRSSPIRTVPPRPP